jgi:hypothetical protein
MDIVSTCPLVVASVVWQPRADDAGLAREVRRAVTATRAG